MLFSHEHFISMDKKQIKKKYKKEQKDRIMHQLPKDISFFDRFE